MTKAKTPAKSKAKTSALATDAGGHLSKTQFVLERLQGEGDDITFHRKHDPQDVPDFSRVRRMDIPRFMWDQFGHPEVITVTIEPGDKLNEEAT